MGQGSFHRHRLIIVVVAVLAFAAPLQGAKHRSPDHRGIEAIRRRDPRCRRRWGPCYHRGLAGGPVQSDGDCTRCARCGRRDRQREDLMILRSGSWTLPRFQRSATSWRLAPVSDNRGRPRDLRRASEVANGDLQGTDWPSTSSRSRSLKAVHRAWAERLRQRCDETPRPSPRERQEVVSLKSASLKEQAIPGGCPLKPVEGHLCRGQA